MRILFDGESLRTEGFVFKADCVQRNEENGDRKLHAKGDVVYAMTDSQYDKIPIMPRGFPHGTWEVFSPRPKTSKYLRPYFIPTGAFRRLPIWSLDEAGGYDCETEDLVDDLGYGIHHWEGRTTLGCIRMPSETELLILVKLIHAAKPPIYLEVV